MAAVMNGFSIDWIAWGTAPALLAAVAGTASAFFAGVHLRKTHRKERLDEERGQNERLDQQSAQARLVYAEARWSYGLRNGHVADVRVVNGSGMPVTDIRAQLVPRGEYRFPPDLPQNTDERAQGVQPVASIGRLAKEEHQGLRLRPPLVLPAPRDGNDEDAYNAPERAYTVRLTFTDAADVRWERVDRTQPKRL